MKYLPSATGLKTLLETRLAARIAGKSDRRLLASTRRCETL
ncbi:hypothetical protein C4K27_0059 [Pseudomonas chlororaphis subsp. chlororaphis]|nr:hypothetical protein C4K27_0059 [Pseudomonas chlororaphis subsp. chlororaphis]